MPLHSSSLLRTHCWPAGSRVLSSRESRASLLHLHEVLILAPNFTWVFNLNWGDEVGSNKHWGLDRHMEHLISLMVRLVWHNQRVISRGVHANYACSFTACQYNIRMRPAGPTVQLPTVSLQWYKCNACLLKHKTCPTAVSSSTCGSAAR